MLPDRIFYPLFVVTFAVLIALALVWPQGQGTPSPAPFGHPMAAPVKDPSLTEKLRAAFTQ